VAPVRLEVGAVSESSRPAERPHSAAPFADAWPRISGLVVRLRGHLEFHRHRYRGQLWYVLGDPSGDRYHRFTPRTYQFLQRFDGKQSVSQVWEAACDELGDEAPTQSEVIALLSQLHLADALAGEQGPDVHEVFLRYEAQRKRKMYGKLMSPMFLQFPLLDPEQFLRRTMPSVRWVFGRGGALLWCLVVGAGLALGALKLDALTADFAGRVFATQNLVVLWFVYPVVKVLHEFGHAYAVKRYGGEVHELGVLLMVFIPLPYVDASSASTFPDKRERIVVGAAGMIVELFLAGLAMLVWVNVEDGLVRAVAYNMILIAGVSTILFNGNPLLRYDGYYILSDLVEIPNLRQRANAYLLWMAERYLCRNEAAQRPDSTPGERRWFVGFGILSFGYRILVLGGIVLLISSKFFFAGILLAAWSVLTWIGLPLVKGLTFLLSSPRLHAVRARGIATTTVVLLALGLGLFAVPMPRNTTAEGIVWVPEGSVVRAGAAGFVDEVLVEDGEQVTVGQELFRCSDPELIARRDAGSARLRELEARYNGARTTDRVAAAQLLDQLAEIREEVAHLQRQVGELVIVAPKSGQLVIVLGERFEGLFFERGQPLGQVLDYDDLSVRVVVPQEDADLVRSGSRRTSVRLVHAPEEPVEAELVRQVPLGRERLPSNALGSYGGGDILVDPREATGDVALEPLFEFELALRDAPEILHVGGRVHARFEHDWSPYGPRIYRELRRLFLSKVDA